MGPPSVVVFAPRLLKESQPIAVHDSFNVRFAVASPPQTFTPTEAQLIAAGALGKMQFRWRLDGGPERPSSADTGQEQKPVTSPKP